MGYESLGDIHTKLMLILEAHCPKACGSKLEYLIEYLKMSLGRSDYPDHAKKFVSNLLRNIEQIHPFVFMESIFDKDDDLSTALANKLNGMLDAKTDVVPSIPFPVCSFECVSAPLVSWDKCSTSLCILLQEARPGYYHVFALSLEHGPSKPYPIPVSTVVPFEDTEFGRQLSNRYGHFVSYLLNNKDNRTARTGRTTRISINKRGFPMSAQIQPFVYLSSVIPEKRVGSVSGIPVQWSHSWEVMGHWRHCAGTGKNRLGEYNVNGFTWVVPHVRGEGELVKKTRIVQTPLPSIAGSFVDPDS